MAGRFFTIWATREAHTTQYVVYFMYSGVHLFILNSYDMLYIHIPLDTYKQKLKNKFKVSFFFCVESIVGNFTALPRTMTFLKVPSSYQHILKAFAWLSQESWWLTGRIQPILVHVCVCEVAVQRRRFSNIPHCRGKHSLSSSCFGATLLLVTVLPGVREMLRFFKKHILNLCPESPTCFERLLARTVHAGMNYEVTQGHKCILLCDFYLYPFSSTWELMGVSPADFWATLELKVSARWPWDCIVSS